MSSLEIGLRARCIHRITAARSGRRCDSVRPLSFSTSTRPLKLAIIGAGPSGFYTASRILSLLPQTSTRGQDVEIHMYERLPTPYGLVRYGVAPDHPEVKNCQHKFDELAVDPRFRFFGNVSIGTTSSLPAPSFKAYTYPHALHLPLSSLFSFYTTILFSYGSSLSNPLPTTAGSSSSNAPLDNVLPALSFVSWYNGHPAYAHLQPDFSNERATIVGHGNVAIDCARVLLRSVDELERTDMPTSVIERLRTSRVRDVEVVGRRGPAQVSFTTKEFREMVNLPGLDFEQVDPGLMADARKMVVGDRAKGRLLDLLDKGNPSEQITRGNKRFSLGFLRSPKAFLPSSPTHSTVSSVSWSKNSLLAPPAPLPSPLPAPPVEAPTKTLPAGGGVIARPTGEDVTTSAGLVIESVGYRSEGLGSLGEGRNGGEEREGGGAGGEKAWRVPFDERNGRVVNDNGRVVGQDGVMIPGMYAAGWVARGPVGVIASTMQHAYSVASLILSDHFVAPEGIQAASAYSTSTRITSANASGASPLAAIPPRSQAPPELWSSGKRVVEMRDWRKIDEAEVRRGKEGGKGKVREKFTTVEEMLEVL